VVDLNHAVIAGGGLYERLCEVADHRKALGIRHERTSVLLMCAAAMLEGAHNPTEIAEWAKNLDAELLDHLHARRSPMQPSSMTSRTSPRSPASCTRLMTQRPRPLARPRSPTRSRASPKRRELTPAPHRL
jgi:hypothetical protein